MRPRPSATILTGDVHTSFSSPHDCDSIGHGAVVTRRPRHRGGGKDAFRQHSQIGGQPAPPLRISTRRLQVFSYVLAELSSATTLLPDYTKAILNLSRRLVGAWQAVTAAAVARTRYEHALVWAAHHQQNSSEASGLRSSSPRRKATVGDRGFITTPRRSLRRRSRDHNRSSSGPVTAAAAASSLSPSAGGVLFNPATSSHKRRRLTREATPSTASWVAAVETQRVGKPPPHANAPGDDRIPAPPHVDSPTPSSKHLQADVAVTPPLASHVDRRRSVRHSRAVPRRHQYFVQMTLQQLWLDAQEAEDRAGQNVEYIRGLVVNALYQQYLQVTVEASYHDLVLYRWLSPSLFEVCCGGARARQTRSRRGYRQPHRSASAHRGGGSLWHARHHQAAVQVAADLRLLRCVLGRARIAAGPSPGAGGHGGGGSGVVVASPAVGHGSLSHSPAPPSQVPAGDAVRTGDCATFTNVDGVAAAARANSEGGNGDAAAAPRSASADSSRSSSELSSSDALGDHTLAVPMPLHSFLQACLSFDPTHCAFALMSRCVVLAQHVRSEDDEQAVPLPVATDGSRVREGAQGRVGRADEGAAAKVDGEEPSREYVGLFYVVIARRAVGACGCSAVCFGNHKFIFVRCHDTEALLREAMAEADSDEGASENSEASTPATVDAEELHLDKVSRLSAEATAATPASNEVGEETDKLARVCAQAQLSNSASSAAAMAATVKSLRGRLPLSRLHAHSQQTSELTLPLRTRGISALRTHDAQRLKRGASEYSDTGERGLAEEAKPPRKASLEAETHTPLPSLPSTPSSDSLHSTPPRQLHSPVPSETAPTANAAWSGAMPSVAAIRSSIAATHQRGRSLSTHTPSAHAKLPSVQACLTMQGHSSAESVSAVAPGRASTTAATTEPTSPALAQWTSADDPSKVASGPDASRQSRAAREGSTPLSPPPRQLQEAAGALPEDRAVAEEESMNVECSRTPVLHLLHTDCSRYAVKSGLSARCIASATHPISGSARLPSRTSSSASLASSSAAAAFSGLDDDADGDEADAVDCARRLQQRRRLIAEFSDRIAEGVDEWGTAGEAAAADDGDVFSGGGTQVFVVMHSLICSFGADGTTKECYGAADRATAESSPFTGAAARDLFQRGHSRQHEADMLPRDSTQRPSHFSFVPCAPNTDFPLSYVEQHVLLPPGSGQERRAGGGCSGGSDDQVLRPRVLSTEAGWRRPSPGSPPVHGAVPACTPLSHAGPRVQGAGAEAASAEHRVVGTAQGAEVPLMEEAALAPLDPQKEDLDDGARDSTAVKRRGASSCRPPRALGASGASAVEPSEGDMAFAAELYARLHFWSLRGQDRSAYIDPSWTRQARQRDHEGMTGRASSAAHDLAGNTEGLEEGVEGHPRHPPAPLSGHTTGADTPTGVEAEMGRATPGTGASGEPPSGAGLRSSLHPSASASEVKKARDAIRLPFRLLDCTVGTIELADEAGLASPRAGGRLRKRRRAVHAEGRQAKRRSSMVEDSDTTDEEADEPSTTEGGECDKGPERLLRLPPFTTVNARGKELLFEALQEATDVVVCGVRESRAHAGYHDMLHQRCPPPPTSTSVSAAPPNKPSAHSGGDANSAGSFPCADSAAATPTGTPRSTWLTTVNPWLAAATAAVQGCSFRVATGTLSRDERNPFAFDTHLHLGTCGVVRWSQGDISHEEEAGDSPTDASWDQAVLAVAASTSDGAFHAAEGTNDDATHHHDHVHRSDSPRMPKWRWPKLPANDHKQWRCELLKSEFRLARSRCLDCLLVDHTHGRPIAAVTLTPRAWPQSSFDSASDAVCSDADDGADEETRSRRCTERHPTDAEASEAPSPQEVVQRTVYVVSGFTHYVAPLWRHLREEKAVLVDMDRTLIDNAITVRSAAERQRHLGQLRRVMAVAEGVVGASNPCILRHQQTTAPSSAFFAGALSRLGRNDAPPLTEEELAEAITRGADEQEDVLCHGSRAHQRYGDRTETVVDDGVLRPTIRQRPLHNRESAASHTKTAAAITSSSSSGGLLHCFMRRTASQRQSLGIVHYEECGAVKYTAGSLPASGPDLAADASSKSSRDHIRSELESHDALKGLSVPSADADAFRSNSSKSVTTAAPANVIPSVRCFFDVVYVRPGVRQFLYRVATQWNIPLVLVTKSTRSRTEAILRQVLDPHSVLFPDMQLNVVTADEMLRWCDEEAMSRDAIGRDEGAGEESSAGFAGSGGGTPVHHSSSATSSVPHAGHACLVPLHTTAPTSTAERIARCRKGALRVVQLTLDAAATMAARRAWRAPAWCDWPNRLPKPRSIAVVDDAPQVWEESDWPCTVSVSPYTLARVDPRAYFSRRGYATSLVLSCLYGSKCLVCSEGVLRLPGGQEAETSPSSSSSHTRSASRSTRESPGFGAYRWPHCVCVCLPDHLRDVSRAEEGAPAGYHHTSYSAAASDLSASVSAMLTALLWRMSNKAALYSSQQQLMLPAIEDSVAAGPAGRSGGAGGQAGVTRHGGGRRSRRPFHPDDLGATLAPGSEGCSALPAAAEGGGRRETTRLGTFTPVAAFGRIGWGARLRHLDTDALDIVAPSPLPSLPVFAGATGHTFASASASVRSASSSPSSPSTSSPSVPTTASSLFSVPFAWGGRFVHAAANPMRNTGSNTPSTIITAASMPPTPVAFRATPELLFESRAPGGEVEADVEDQQTLRVSGGDSDASATLSGKTTVGEEGFLLPTSGEDSDAAASTMRYGALRSSSFDVDDVVPLEMQATQSMPEPLCAPRRPSHSVDGVGGDHSVSSVDLASLSAGSHKASWVSRSATSVPAEDVVPMSYAPEALAEGLVANPDESAPLEVCEAELQSPWRWRLDDPCDEVEDVTPL
ncbi:hypothetical protein GH5_05427 [Leishmania sp. Ghana 2012 LV757]|uniref:hypothetical protein n=1 Tax=Leishmania sp. Ghana 2012 LV757 TaxID=2803181 RepID=UPI001B4BE04A|nr:hypothetical protein GH5_05427 [Leishmania sp. Ghana 2012 LV757]